MRVTDRLPLLVGLFGGPLIWTMHELLSEILISSACASRPGGFQSSRILGVSGWELVMLAVSLCLVVLAAGVDLLAVRAWRETRSRASISGEAGGAWGRSGFLALGGILVSSLFLIAIVWATLPIFFVSGCN